MIVHGRAGRSVTVGYASLVYKFLVSSLGWYFRPPNTQTTPGYYYSFFADTTSDGDVFIGCLFGADGIALLGDNNWCNAGSLSCREIERYGTQSSEEDPFPVVLPMRSDGCHVARGVCSKLRCELAMYFTLGTLLIVCTFKSDETSEFAGWSSGFLVFCRQRIK